MPVKQGSVPYDPSRVTHSIADLLALNSLSVPTEEEELLLSTATLNLMQSTADMMGMSPQRAAAGHRLDEALQTYGDTIVLPVGTAPTLPSKVQDLMGLGAVNILGATVELGSDLLSSGDFVLPLDSDLFAAMEGTSDLDSEVSVALLVKKNLASDILIHADATNPQHIDLGGSLFVRAVFGTGSTVTLSSTLGVATPTTLALDSDVAVASPTMMTDITSDALVIAGTNEVFTADMVIADLVAVDLDSDFVAVDTMSSDFDSDVLISGEAALGIFSAVSVREVHDSTSGALPLGSGMYVTFASPSVGALGLSSDLLVTDLFTSDCVSDVVVEQDFLDPLDPTPTLDSDVLVFATGDLSSDVLVSNTGPHKSLFTSVGVQSSEVVGLTSDMKIISGGA